MLWPHRSIAGVLLLGLGLSAPSSAPVASGPWSLAGTVLAAPLVRQVLGDFDGDARLDQCEIVGATRIAVRLSTTSAPQQLTLAEGGRQSIVALASIDIDHDGDLDLVASLSDGGIAVWINGGHGDFARTTPRPHPAAVLSTARLSLSGLLVFVGTTVRVDALPARPIVPSAVLHPVDTPRRTHPVVASLSLRLARPVRAPPLRTL
jgi:hypothetical protein